MGGNKNIINFGAGPAKLPRKVMEEVKEELLDFDGTGISIIESSHRGAVFGKVNQETIDTARRLLKVPDNYKVLLMQGGGTCMFSAVPLNLIQRTGTADYVVTGIWSSLAAKEAEKYGTVNLINLDIQNSEELPDQLKRKLNPEASYVYYCANETIEGFELPFTPETNGVPLVCDMSSNIMTKPVDVSKYGIIFAGAQKNIGPAGTVLVIIREDLLDTPFVSCPKLLNFKLTAEANSLLNTPPTFVVYVVGKVLKWIENEGGLEEMNKKSLIKSNKLYKLIDESNGFYVNSIPKSCRSRVNVTFRTAGQQLDDKFVAEATKRGMLQLKGHKTIGGIRASLYNAVTLDEVESLINFMKQFTAENS